MKKINLKIFAIGITTLSGTIAFFNIKATKKNINISNKNNVIEAEKCISTMHL